MDEKGRRVSRTKRVVYDETKTSHKRIKDRCESLFTELKVTLATSDALLIAEWCRRKVEGRLTRGVMVVK